MNALAFATLAAELAPVMISAGKSLTEVIGFLTRSNQVVEAAQAEGRDVTEEELDESRRIRDEAHQALQRS